MKTHFLQSHITYQLLAILLVASVILAPATAWGFFSDDEIASAQRFGAGTLALTDQAVTPAAHTISTETTGTSTLTVETEAGSLPTTYDIVTTSSTGSQTWCDALQVQTTAPDGTVTTDSLADVTTAPHTQTGAWELVFSTTANASAMDEAVCSVTFTTTAWQDAMYKDAGFTDSKSVTIDLTYSYIEPEPEEESATEDESNTDGDNHDTGANTDDATSTPPSPGDVVINEVMWMGSSAGAGDEWIELRNTTSNAIDLSGWTVANSAAANGTLTLPASSSLPADGFFLLAAEDLDSSASAVQNPLPTEQWHQESDVSLANGYDTNGALTLADASSTVIDATPVADSSSWPEGESDAGTARWSMQRGANPGDGTDANNWYTCTPSVLQSDGTYTQMQGYWKSGQDINCGTPGQPNLSSNDPTKARYDPAAFTTESSTAATTEESDTESDDTETTTSDDTADQTDTTADEDPDDVEKRKEDDEESEAENEQPVEEESLDESGEEGSDEESGSTDEKEGSNEVERREEEGKPEESNDPVETTKTDDDAADDDDMTDGTNEDDSEPDVSEDETDNSDSSNQDEPETTVDDSSSNDDDVTVDDSSSNDATN